MGIAGFINLTPSATDYQIPNIQSSDIQSSDKQASDTASFSQSRALSHLQKLSEHRHHVGSEKHATARDYIVDELRALGLDVQVQKQSIVRRHGSYRSTTAENIVARIKGHSNGPSLGLISHYDSGVHSSYGAADAGSGVATILEAIRVFIHRAQQPRNDIIIIITDAEEVGLLGAQAFVERHPWSKDLGLVLNFEARGSGGPSYMLIESNNGNAELIRHFSKVDLANPQANSLMYGIYKHLPNDTDLTVFRESGNINGFNFAFIDDHFDYHTARDTVANLDLSTLNHQAQYLIGSLEYFSSIDLSQLTSDIDHVYFNAPALGMLHYPSSWGIPLLIISAALALILIGYNVHTRELKISGLFLGLFGIVIQITAIIGFSFGTMALLETTFVQINDSPHGFPYMGHGLMWGLLAATLLIWYFSCGILIRYSSDKEMLSSSIIVWVLLNTAIAVYLSVAGFFIIPLIVGTLLLLVKTFSKSLYTPLLASFLLAPVILVFFPLIPSFTIGLGLNNIWISSLLLVLLLTLFSFLKGEIAWQKLITFTLIVIIIASFVQAISLSTYDSDRKKPSSLIYIQDEKQEKAWIASYNKHLDAYTSEHFNKPLAEFDKNDLYPVNRKSSPNWVQERTTLDLKSAAVNTELNHLEDGIELTLYIQNQRGSHLYQIAGAQGLKIKSLAVNGYKLKDEKLSYTVSPRGLLLSHFLKANETTSQISIHFGDQNEESLKQLLLYDIAFDLNDQDGFQSRPKDTMAEPFLINDATVIRLDIGSKITENRFNTQSKNTQ